ncbi:MAG: tryptophan synthase subunit alpha [Microbacteriaceae bacterium]|nr:tryptophan synthase subunit alpha [Microbacteriaceae bacterium]
MVWAFGGLVVGTIDSAIIKANQESAGALIGYIPAGYPDVETSIEAAVALLENGFDAIELGIPYSDPVMDGTVIQQTTTHALEQGFKVADFFAVVRGITARSTKPVLTMTYYNIIHAYGLEKFATNFVAAGGVGVIIPDLIVDEAAPWLAAAKKHGLETIFLASSTSTDERLARISQASSGFVYAVSTLGVTGARTSLDQSARELVTRLKEQSVKNSCVGIGISNAEQVKEVLSYAEGAIVGSALVTALVEGGVRKLAQLATDLVKGKSR